MDLILLKPGDSDDIIGKKQSGNVSLIDSSTTWADIKSSTPDDCIELVSMHHGMKQQITTDVSNRARTSGRPNISDITCVKYTDYSSPKFFEYCLKAKPIGADKNISTIYILRNSGTATTNIITFELKNAIISHIEFQSHPNDMPTEQFMLNFTAIRWTCNVQKNDVTAGGSITTAWNVSANVPCFD